MTAEEQEQRQADFIESENERRAAMHKALALLEKKIGKDSAANIQNGGAYPVRSRQWPDVIYYIPREPHERIKVMANGVLVMESCLVTTDYNLPWPDVMLQRILALEADETIVAATGVVHQRAFTSLLTRLRRVIGIR